MHVGIYMIQLHSLWIHVYLWKEESGFQRAQWGMWKSKQAFGKELFSKKLQKCVGNMTPYFFLIPHAEAGKHLGNKILLNIVSSGITFLFFFFLICFYIFQNIYHKLASFLIRFFESIWSRVERFFFPIMF